MSEKKEILVLSSPDFGVGKETIGTPVVTAMVMAGSGILKSSMSG